MGLLDPLKERVDFVKGLTPAELKRLANLRLTDLIVREAPRARIRIAELEKRYPSAQPKELAQRLIDEKKSLAGLVGGVSGVFGILGLPADLLVMVWLELVLLTDIATLYKANLKAESARAELLDLFSESNGVGPWTRSTPRAVGTFAGLLLRQGWLKYVGRGIPAAASFVSAWLNNRHIQQVGEAAVHHYEGFGKARKKSQKGTA